MDVTVAGFTIAGMPASSVGASFSSIPHTGKLNALMWTATPSSGTQMCRPTNVPPFESDSIGAVDVERLVRKLAAALARVDEERADAAVDVDPRVGFVAPVAGESRYRPSFRSLRYFAISLSMSAR
jgi:hypothetical protein